jgi:transcriptional/translational regulatory protein YebC/TACO1
LIVECVTDNINRTVAEIRVAFRKGQLGASGSVAWDFNHVGMIEASPDTPDADPEMAAIEAGAQDFEDGEEEGATLFITDPPTSMPCRKPCRSKALPCCRPSWATAEEPGQRPERRADG